MARLIALGAALVLGAASPFAFSACASAPPVAASAKVEVAPEQAVDPRAPIVLSLRPAALRRDEVFGPLVTTLSSLAAARGVAGTRELEAFEAAEELRIAVDEASAASLDGNVSAVVIARGTRADLVPEKILDGDGKLLFKSGRATGAITEHEGYAEEPISLFVLPRRTWVVASGAAAARARAAFAEARPAPKLPFDEGALLELRIDGKSLVAHVPRLERGELAIGRRLSDATLRLLPSRGGLVLLLGYTDVDAAAWAENTLVRVVRAFSRRLEGPLAWLGGTTVVREGTTVRLRAEVPAAMVEALKNIDARALLEGSDRVAEPVGDAGASVLPAGDAGAIPARADAGPSVPPRADASAPPPRPARPEPRPDAAPKAPPTKPSSTPSASASPPAAPTSASPWKLTLPGLGPPSGTSQGRPLDAGARPPFP